MLRTLLAAFAAGLFVVPLPVSAQPSTAPAAPRSAVHAHPAHGPHNGELLEVGKEEYHVELLIDEAKKQLTVYLMDGQVKDFVAVDAPFLAVNLKMEGKPVQVKLLPVPQAKDPKGFSSRYGISNPDLLKALHGGHADARLGLKIGNKAYSVKIEHHHDYAGHRHGPTIVK